MTKLEKSSILCAVLKELNWKGIKMEYRFRIKYGYGRATIELKDLVKIIKIKQEKDD